MSLISLDLILHGSAILTQSYDQVRMSGIKYALKEKAARWVAEIAMFSTQIILIEVHVPP